MDTIATKFFLIYLATSVSAFVLHPKRVISQHGTLDGQAQFDNVLKSSSSGGDNNEEGESSLEAMRRLLEGTWNVDAMGAVPDSPEAAAHEAGGSLVTGRERGLSLMIVNLLLPSYDITQGPTFYDEVEAVSFCIALGKVLQGKAAILVRDNKTRHTVTRVLEAREAAAKQETSTNAVAVVEDNEEEDVENDDKYVGEEDYQERDGDENNADSKESELEDFRKQLMSEWGSEKDDDVVGEDDPKSAPQSKREKELPKTTKPKQQASVASSSPVVPKNYRLTSMFGDANFRPGPDMFDKVIQAVSINAQPKDDEDVLIILSAASEEETIAIRALVNKYQHSRTIVLVNCHLDPIPRELIKAETIYSLLPLIARPKDEGKSSSNDASPQPKVVVMRRYPRDFEVFMDFGNNGFELVETVIASRVGKAGPSMQWIADCVKRQMDARV